MAETKLDPKQIGGTATTGQLMQFSGTQWVPVNAHIPHVIRVGVSQGKPEANIEFARYRTTVPVLLAPNFYQGFGMNLTVNGNCRVSPTSPAVFSVKKNGTQFLTLTVNTNGTVTDSWSGGPFDLNAGDTLTFHTPTTQDATLMDVSFTITGRTPLLVTS